MNTPDLLVQWSIAAVVALALLARRQLTLFHAPTIYLGFHVLAYCLRPTLLHVLGSDGAWAHLGLPRDPEGLRHALWVSSAALAVLTLAYLVVTRRAPPLRPAAPHELDAGDRRALAITLAIALVPSALAAYAVRGTSQPSVLLADLSAVLLAPAAVLVVASHWRWWSLLPLGAWIAARSSIPIADTAPALILSTTLLVVLLALWTRGRRGPSAFVLVACAVVALAVFAVDWRGTAARWSSQSEAPPAAASESPWIRHLRHPTLGYTEALAAVTGLVPAKTGGYTNGAQHLAWLPGSPQATLSRQGTTRSLLQRHANLRRMPLPLVAEAWVSGGWPGVVITFGFAGVLLGWVFLAFSRRQDDPASAAFLAIALGWSLPWFTHGGEAVLRILPLALASLLVWRFLANRFRKNAEAALDRERLREERHRRRLIGNALLNPEAGEVPPGAIAASPGGDRPPEPPSETVPAPPRWRSTPPP